MSQIIDDTNLKEGDYITAKNTVQIRRFGYDYMKDVLADAGIKLEEFIHLTVNKKYKIIAKYSQVILEGPITNKPQYLTHNINILDDKENRASFKIVVDLLAEKKNNGAFPVIKKMDTIALDDPYLYDYFYT